MADPDDRPGPEAGLHVFLAVVVGVALIGFFAGTDRGDYELEAPPLEVHAAAAHDDGHEIARARSYRELQRTPRGSDPGWPREAAILEGAVPGVFAPLPSSGSKVDALADRGALRAYAGAPPRIPHPIRQDSAPECLACHDGGLRIRGLAAPAMSHDGMTSCTQCHVVDAAPMPGGADLPPDPRAVPNAFAGDAEPTAGPRWALAPPQIPHRTFMRERCESCHGVNGRDAIRSSHPYRESCTQCHSPSAALDQRPGAAE